jgi:type II secretory pathway pseudopilin PulG
MRFPSDHRRHRESQRDLPQAKGDEGFSLIVVLVVMGVLLLNVLIFSQSRVNSSKAVKTLQAKSSYRDVSQAFIYDLVEKIRPNINAAAPCLNLGSIQANINNFNVVNKASPSYIQTNQITVAPQAPALHQGAAQRCLRPRTPANGNQANQHQFYFCARLGRDTSAPLDSILNAELAFAELAISMIDLQTQVGISCADYRNRLSNPNDGSAGLAVTAILYWHHQRLNVENFSQKTFSFIINQKD